MSQRLSWWLLGAQLLALLVGTQMPGAWRSGVIDALHAPSILSSLAHLVLFAGMAAVAVAKPLTWSVLRTATVALTLALLTEGLHTAQRSTVDAHADVRYSLPSDTIDDPPDDAAGGYDASLRSERCGNDQDEQCDEAPQHDR